MKQNKLKIKISKPINIVFAYVINPEKSPLWVDSFSSEETNEWPVKLGSVYKENLKKSGQSSYTVTAFKENKIFELTSQDKNYHVHYTFTPIDNNLCTLEYFEWVDKGELEEPFTMEVLENLRKLIENS